MHTLCYTVAIECSGKLPKRETSVARTYRRKKSLKRASMNDSIIYAKLDGNLGIVGRRVALCNELSVVTYILQANM